MHDSPVSLQAAADTLTRRRASGAAWVLLAAALVATSLVSLLVAPLSRHVSVLRTTLPMLAAGLACFGAVLALGGRVVCRPVLRPDLVQPWLPESRENGKEAQ